MIQALLIKTKTSNKTANRIYNDITKRFQTVGVRVESRSRMIVSKERQDDTLNKDVFIFLATQESIQDSEWISAFESIASRVKSDRRKLLIALTVDESLTKPFFDSMNVGEWLPLEADPNNSNEDIQWMIDRIRKFAIEQGLEMPSSKANVSRGAFDSKFAGELQPQPDNNSIEYYFLKINEANWLPAKFAKGQQYFFNANHHHGENQSDHLYFQKLKTGDLLFIFALPAMQQVVALFKVIRPLYVNNEQAEQVDLEVQNLIDPPIGMDELQGLPFFDRLNYQSNEKLYPLPVNMAAGLLAGRILLPVKSNNDDYKSQISSLTRLSTDAPTQTATDELEIMADVKAIASVIAYKEVSPPLAIGLFGNWGSGKSFFMQKIESVIADLAGSDPDFYCEGIVPVHFNSWHYSDANLWASLSSRIFDALSEYGKQRNPGQLETLFSQLHSTNEQAELAKQKSEQAATAIRTLTDKLAKNETLIKEKVDKLQDVKLIDIASKVLENKKIKKDIDEIKEKADFVKWDDLDDVKTEAEKIKGAGGKIWALTRQAYGFTKGKLWKALFVFGLIILLVWIAEEHIDALKQAKPYIQSSIRWGSVVLTQLILFIGPAMKVINKVSSRLGELGETIKEIQKEEKEKLDGQLKGLKAEISGAQAEQQTLKNQQEQLEVKKALIEAEISDIRSGKKVISFIESRVTDERYVKSLGMISWVRKDFEMLESLLKQQQAASGQPGTENNFRIDRIVLYIDDLDRCKEDTVVEVLEAIHLLLAIPLFVVIVGVDPQWMESSLTKKFGGMITQGGKEAITPLKYLEKIFQIPFRLRSVDNQGFRHLVASQFSGSGSPAFVPVIPPVPGPNDLPQQEPAGPVDPVDTGLLPVNPGTDPDLLIISEDEITFMQGLSKVIPNSPRTIKRYVNIYRIIRSHSELRFGEAIKIYHYQAVMILLAVLVGIPVKTKTFFEAVMESDPGTTFNDFINDARLKEDFAELQDELNLVINQVKSMELGNIAMSCFQLNTHLISRFTFYYK